MPGSFYRRKLNAPCIAFSSPKGRQIFRDALESGTMECYFELAEQFRTQDEPSFCGLGALTTVLNALHIDPKRSWKGVWRHFSESMLACCKSLDQVKKEGINLEEFTCLARCNGAHATTKRPDDSENTLEAFRRDIMEFCEMSEGGFLVVSYSRKVLNQTGDGHFSPIAGYCKENDRALILDVARFKYPPHWVPVEVLYDAMKPKDSDTGKSRGWTLLTSAHAALVFSWKDDNLFDLQSALEDAVNTSNTNVDTGSAEDTLCTIFDLVYKRLLKSLWTQSYLFQIQYSAEHEAVVNSVLQQVRATKLYSYVASWADASEAMQALISKSSLCIERLTVALFVLDLQELIGAIIDGEAKTELAEICKSNGDDEYLTEEIVTLKSQYMAVITFQEFQGDEAMCKDHCKKHHHTHFDDVPEFGKKKGALTPSF